MRWVDGEVITSDKLNSIETRLDTHSDDIYKLKNLVSSGGSLPSGGSTGGTVDYVFDLRYIPASAHGELMMRNTRVNQCIAINVITGQFFTSRVHDDSSGACAIASYDENGTMIKELILTQGEHGTCFGIEPVWNSAKQQWDNYIWTHMKNNNTNLVVRFNFDAFSDGASVTATSAGIQTINTGSTLYSLPSVDFVNDKVALCRKNSNTYSVEVYKLSELKVGTVNRVGQLTLSQSQYLQGFAIANDRVYWRTGNANGSVADELFVYSWENNLFLYKVNTGALPPLLDENNITEGFREPEGMCVYINPQTGRKSLFICTSVGASGNRQHLLHAYHQDVSAGLVGRVVGRGQHHSITHADGTLKKVHANADSFAKITELGEYYLTSSEYNRMSDKPIANDSLGWFLIVSGHRAGSDDSEHVQRLITNAGGSFCEYIRINRTGGATPWKATTAEYVPINETKSKLASYNHSGTFYFTTAEMNGFSDKPDNWESGGYFLEVSPRSGSECFVQTLTRNGVAKTPVVYKRIVNNTDNTVSPWGLVSTSVVILTQSQYNSLSNKDSSTIYIIK